MKRSIIAILSALLARLRDDGPPTPPTPTAPAPLSLLTLDPRCGFIRTRDDPRFGRLRFQQTEAGWIGPIFESLEGFRAWQAAGRPKLRGPEDGDFRFRPRFEKLPA